MPCPSLSRTHRPEAFTLPSMLCLAKACKSGPRLRGHSMPDQQVDSSPSRACHAAIFIPLNQSAPGFDPAQGGCRHVPKSSRFPVSPPALPPAHLGAELASNYPSRPRSEDKNKKESWMPSARDLACCSPSLITPSRPPSITSIKPTRQSPIHDPALIPHNLHCMHLLAVAHRAILP